MAIDLSQDEGRELLYRLVREADVFSTNYLPHIRSKLKIDVDDIRAINPSIIYARGTGQGTVGSEAERGGFDMASSWSRGGTGFAMTPPDGEPPFQPGSFGDLSGGMNMAGAIAAALFRRERTGKGAVVDVALYSTGMWMMAQSITGAPMGRTVPRFTRATGQNPLVNFYPTSDDRWICLVMLQADRWWPDLARHLEHEELASDSRFSTADERFKHREEFVATLDKIFRSRTLKEWRLILATTEGVWAPVMSPSDISEDPQALENGFFPEVKKDDDTTFRIVASPTQFDEEPVGELRRAPHHGEHTDQALLELGLDWDAIIELKLRSVIL